MVVGPSEVGVFMVKGVSFQVKRNERFVILGANNSGTSAVLQAMLGVKKQVAGEIMIDRLQLNKKEIKYKNLHGIIGYQP